MTIGPEVLALLEEMLDTGRTAEDVCRDRPDLLTEVRHRWKAFRVVDEAVAALLPGTQLADASDSATKTSLCSDLPQIPGYRVEAELGHGGMGIVYRAWHERLRRSVALKMLLGGTYSHSTERERFQREAEAIAALHHPNIVQIYDVGEVEGRPYFTMEFVDGGNLANHFEGVPQPADKVAALVSTLADAVAVAHQSGIVHRDLKPSNILLTSDGTPKVTDFGLARRLEGDGDLTLSGSPVGTPSYMSPEQARGDKSAVGIHSDVYALGAILYELLTGRPPFRADTATATLRQVVAEDPVSPVRLNPRVPRDLETICLKCLEKEPTGRYRSAAELADDLNRFRRHEPIRARPVGVLGHLSRWAQRHPGIASLTATLVATAIVAITLILYQWRTAENARAATDRMAVRLVLDRGIILCERGHIGLGLHWFARGIELAERSGDADLMPALRANLTVWSSRHVVPRVSPPFGSSVTTVAFHPDGKRLLVARWKDAFEKPGPGLAQVVDADTWVPRGTAMEHPGGVRTADFSPDGTHVVTAGGDGNVRLWDTDSGRPLGKPLKAGTFLAAVAFAPDGRTFATADITSDSSGEARIWNATTLEPMTSVMVHRGRLHCLAFSPDGRTLATGCGPVKAAGQLVGGETRFWDSQTGLPIGPVLVHSAPVSAVAFSPDGQTFVTGSADGVLLRWQRATWERLSPPMHHFSPLRAAVFSPDGRNLLTAHGVSNRPKENEDAVRLWDSDSGTLLVSPWTYPQPVGSISRSPDGLRFATGCADGHVRIYPFPAVQPKRWRYLDGIQSTDLYTSDVAALTASGDVVTDFSPDGRTLLVGGNTPDGQEAARLVGVFTGKRRDLLPQRKPLLVGAATVVGMAAPPEGGGGPWALGTLAAFRTQKSLVDCVAFGPTGKTALTTGDNGQLRIWDVASGDLIQGPRSYAKQTVPWMVLMPDQSKVVTGGRGRPIEVWDRDTGQRVVGPINADAYVQAMTLSPDGRTLATAGDGGIVQLWDVHTGQSLSRFDAVNNTIWSLRYSPDGKLLLAGGVGTAWLFDVSTGKQRCPPMSHSDAVWEARFSPDGRRLLTICSDEYRDLHPGTVQIWDIATGRRTGPPLPHHVAGLAAAFSPEGNLVATGGFDGDVRFWDAATAAPVGPALVQSGPVPAIAFVSGTNSSPPPAGMDISRYGLYPDRIPEAEKEVRERVQSLTGQVFDETDALRD